MGCGCVMDVSKKRVLRVASLPGDYQFSSPMKPVILQAAYGHMLYLKGGYCLGLVGGVGMCCHRTLPIGI